jgi:hypothetical protein
LSFWEGIFFKELAFYTGATSVTFIRVGPQGYFTHISITTPIVSALKKLLYLELSRRPNGFFNFKVLLDPGGGFNSETAARQFQKLNGRYETVSEVKRLQISVK